MHTFDDAKHSIGCLLINMNLLNNTVVSRHPWQFLLHLCFLGMTYIYKDIGDLW